MSSRLETGPGRRMGEAQTRKERWAGPSGQEGAGPEGFMQASVGFRRVLLVGHRRVGRPSSFAAEPLGDLPGRMGAPGALLPWLVVVLLVLMPVLTAGNVCPIPTNSGGVNRNKTCPDFKANPQFVYCCTSKLPPTNAQAKEKHGVYCCALEDFEKEQQEAAAAEFRGFLKDYFALIVFGTVLTVSLLIIFMAIVCKRIPGCPMYRNIQLLSHASEQPSAGMYRPVDTIPPKMYEAPPPYECFVPPPPDGHDWNCVLENEVNGSRRIPPQVS